MIEVEGTFSKRYIELARQIISCWTKGDWRNRELLLQGYERHNAHIQAIVPKDRLLVWTPGDEWDGLCRHLGKEVPQEPFPHVNKGDNVAQMHKLLAAYIVMILIERHLKWPLMVAAGGLIAYAALKLYAYIL